MRRYLLVASLLTATLSVALGFNTLDWMVNVFAWSPPIDQSWMQGQWHMNTWLVMDFWNAYFFCGVLPFGLGMFVLGWTAHHLAKREA